MTWDEWHSVVVVHIHALVHWWAPLQTTAETCAGSTVSSYVKCVALEDMICCIKMKTRSHEAEKTTNVTYTVLTVQAGRHLIRQILTNKTFRGLKTHAKRLISMLSYVSRIVPRHTVNDGGCNTLNYRKSSHVDKIHGMQWNRRRYSHIALYFFFSFALYFFFGPCKFDKEIDKPSAWLWESPSPFTQSSPQQKN